MRSRTFHGTVISGWFTPEQGEWLRERVAGLSGADVALVGIYQGLNLSYIAETCRENGVRIYAVDVWEKIGATLNGTERLPWLALWRFRRDLKRARRRFGRWLREHGFSGHVVVLHDRSTAAARSFADASLDFVFLDADHGYEAVLQDLEAWYGKLKPSRLIAGDDWDPGKWPGVVRAVEEFAGTRGLRVQVEDKLWSLEKPQEDAPASS